MLRDTTVKEMLGEFSANLATERDKAKERKENNKTSLFKTADEIYKIAPELNAEIERNFELNKINIFNAKKQQVCLKEGLEIINTLVSSAVPDFSELNRYLSENHPNTKAWKKFKAALWVASGVLVSFGSAFALTTPAWPIFFPGLYISFSLIHHGTKMWYKADEHPFSRSDNTIRFFGKMSEIKEKPKMKAQTKEIENKPSL